MPGMTSCGRLKDESKAGGGGGGDSEEEEEEEEEEEDSLQPDASGLKGGGVPARRGQRGHRGARRGHRVVRRIKGGVLPPPAAKEGAAKDHGHRVAHPSGWVFGTIPVVAAAAAIRDCRRGLGLGGRRGSRRLRHAEAVLLLLLLLLLYLVLLVHVSLRYM